MIRLFANANYDFIKWRRWAYGLTAAIIIPGFALFLVHGLNYSIEVTGGTLIQLQTKEAVGTERIRSALDAAGIRDAEIQQFGGPTEYKIQARIAKVGVAEGSTEATAAAVDSALARGLGSGPEHYTIVRTEAVGPKVGRELQGKAFLAIFFSFIVTLFYLAFRFEWRFGLAAVLATFHDILTTIAFFRYLDHETHLEVEIADERDRGEDVVERREHGGEPEAPLEAEREVEQGDDEREKDRQEGLALELAAHLRPDRLGADDGVVLGPGSQTPCQRRV